MPKGVKVIGDENILTLFLPGIVFVVTCVTPSAQSALIQRFERIVYMGSNILY